MSAAALIAQRQSSEPDSTRSRAVRDEPSVSFICGCLLPFGVFPIRGRARHQLPCEP